MNRIKFSYFLIAVFITNIVVSLTVHKLDGYLLIGTDSLGYYQYLPSWFVEHSISPNKWVVKLPNGNPLSLFSFGIALLQLPFFLLGHLFASLSHFDNNGYTEPYAIAQFIASSFYLVTGLNLLFKVLIKKVSYSSSLFSLILITFGTNLFYYSAKEPGVSHVYNFFICSSVIYLVEKICSTNKLNYIPFLGILAGLCVTTKPYNLLFFTILIPLNKKELKQFLKIIKSKWFLASIASFSLFIIAQAIYWKTITDSYFIFSYGKKGEGFNWLQPELYNVLFSPQNGWLIYSPIFLFALVGFYYMYKKEKNFTIKSGVLLVSIYYIISSWWAWWFGAAYGHRAFIEYYPFLVFPLAYFIDYISKNKSMIITFITISALFIFMNLRMISIYSCCWDGKDWGWNNYFNILAKVFYL